MIICKAITPRIGVYSVIGTLSGRLDIPYVLPNLLPEIENLKTRNHLGKKKKKLRNF